MQNNLSFGYVSGLPGEERERLAKLAEVYNYHLSKNALKNRYYEGRIPLSEVNLGLALPQGMKGLARGARRRWTCSQQGRCSTDSSASTAEI